MALDVGLIQVSDPIEQVGKVTDIHGTEWEVVSVWNTNDYVTACKTENIKEDYSRFTPFKVEIIENKGGN